MRTTIVLTLVFAGALTAGEEPRQLGPFGADCRIAFTPDGTGLVATTRGGSAALVDLETGETTTHYKGERDESESAVAVSPDGKRVALATLEGRVRLFETRSGKLLATLEARGPVRSLAFSADGKSLVTGGGPGTNPETGEPDPASPTARVFDATTGAELVAVDAKSGNAGSGVAAAAKGSILAVARADGKLELLDPAQKKRRTVELAGPAGAVTFSPDGELVAALGGKAGVAVTLVHVGKGEVLATFQPGKLPAGPEGALAFSPDGERLARSHPSTPLVLVHSVESGHVARAIELPGAASSLAFSPDGETLAVALRSGDVILYRAGR